jgi:hypothetical protein
MPPTGAPERTAASVARWAWGSGRWREVSLFGVRETHLPGFEGATGWLNSEPLTPDDLRGKVVLVAPRPRHPAQPLHPTSRSSRDDDQPRPRPVIHGAQNASASRASGPIGSGTPPPTAGSPHAAPSPALWPSLAGAAPTCSSDMTAPVSQNALPTKLDGSTSEPSDMARFIPKAQRSSWASPMRIRSGPRT